MAEGRFARLERTGGSSEAVPSAPPPGSAGAPPPPQLEPASPAGALPGPEDYPGFLLLGDEAFFTGNFREALRHYSRALQIQNAAVYPWIGQISALIALRQFKEAELWSGRALEQFPEDPSLLSQRARVLATTGNIQRAIGASDYALGRGGTSWAWLARGEVLLEAADGNALYCFEKAMELAGREDWRIPLLAALAYNRKRQWSNAEQFLQVALATQPKNFFIWQEFARVQVELGRTERARDALSRVFQLKADCREARELEARLYQRPLLKRVMDMFRR